MVQTLRSFLLGDHAMEIPHVIMAQSIISALFVSHRFMEIFVLQRTVERQIAHAIEHRRRWRFLVLVGGRRTGNDLQ
jgi:hypothetical protein